MSGFTGPAAVPEAQTAAIEAACRWLRHARRILVFTGAGISTESGIPDFRGPQGVWRTRDPARYTIDNYLSDVEVRRERWRDRLGSSVEAAAPNAAHQAVVALQRAGRCPVVVTQNIDGLHQLAGAVNVIELHGTTREVSCLECGRRLPVGVVLDRVREGDDDPHCELCGGLLKTATISFGQRLVEEDIEAAMGEAEQCDACLAVGSTLSVWPAAGVVVNAVRNGARLVILNDGRTDLDEMADARVGGRAGIVLPQLIECVLSDRAGVPAG
jgi:NAD-dependent deacetylase